LTVTVKPDAALSCAVASPLPAPSPTLKLALCQATLGGGSSSVIVTVVLVGVPSTALPGLESVRVKVSFGSSLRSLIIAMLIVLLVWPGAKTTLPATAP
jgi:hypothetical protein